MFSEAELCKDLNAQNQDQNVTAKDKHNDFSLSVCMSVCLSVCVCVCLSLRLLVYFHANTRIRGYFQRYALYKSTFYLLTYLKSNT